MIAGGIPGRYSVPRLDSAVSHQSSWSFRFAPRLICAMVILSGKLGAPFCALHGSITTCVDADTFYVATMIYRITVWLDENKATGGDSAGII